MCMRSLMLCLLALVTCSNGSDSFSQTQLELIRQIASLKGRDALEASLQTALDKIKSGQSLGGRSSEDAPTVTAVIGGGLSGLTAALSLLEQGVPVALIDKSPFMGGNSAKASSGINGCYTDQQNSSKISDSADQFFDDTLRSSQRTQDSYTGILARKMADDSKIAVEWIQSRAAVELPDVGQMGGHSAARTHRPRGRLSGAAFVSGLERAVMKFADSGLLTVHKSTALVDMRQILRSDDQTNPAASGDGWELTLQAKGGVSNSTMRVRSVVLATGGYSADKSPGGLLDEFAPEISSIATTNGEFATGDGIKLARGAGARTVDMELVQVHPTGFSDVPAGFKASTAGAERALILCAEILRGVGAVLLGPSGRRFVNELDTRKAVTAKMNGTGYAQFVLALPPAAAAKVQTHVHIYTGKKLLHKVDGARGVAQYVHQRFSAGSDAVASFALADIESRVQRDFRLTEAESYTSRDGDRSESESEDGAAAAVEGVPYRAAKTSLPLSGEYYVGVVQPVLHYTMGGVAIDENASVVNENGNSMPGLYAGGEIIGGVHGVNRLGGSSLLDCVVFGLASAEAATQRHRTLEQKQPSTPARPALPASGAAVSKSKSGTEGGLTGLLKSVPQSDRRRVKIGKQHFDISQFVELHPGGAIDVSNGEDLTPRFLAAHGKDWGLLRRNEIVPVNEQGEEVEREKEEEHHLANYGGKGGSWREIVGRHSWFLIHSIAAKFPEYPTEADRRAIVNFVGSLGQLYPCKLCRTHLQQQLRDPELGSVACDTRTNLTMWMCKLHNIVNRDIGKPLFNCNPLELDLMYLKNCGECEVVKKGDKIVDPTAKSGYHPTSGPWDAELYLQDPLLLQATKSSTDVFETKRRNNLLEAAKRMKLPKKQLAALERTIKGPQGQDWTKKLQKAVTASSKLFKQTLKADLDELIKKP